MVGKKIKGEVFSLFVLIAIVITVGCNKSVSKEGDTLSKKPIKIEAGQVTPAGWGDAADFTLQKLEGGTFTLSSLKGKVIILDFWATWCPPCRKGIPEFIELYNQYKGNGLEVVGILLDQAKQSRLKEIVKEMGINYTVVLGDTDVTAKYGNIRSIPTTFIIDTKGNIVQKYIGYTSKDIFEREINKLFEKENK